MYFNSIGYFYFTIIFMLVVFCPCFLCGSCWKPPRVAFGQTGGIKMKPNPTRPTNQTTNSVHLWGLGCEARAWHELGYSAIVRSSLRRDLQAFQAWEAKKSSRLDSANQIVLQVPRKKKKNTHLHIMLSQGWKSLQGCSHNRSLKMKISTQHYDDLD